MTLLRHVLMLTLILLSKHKVVESNENGAPFTEEVCQTMKPEHEGAAPQSSEAPYTITFTESTDPIKVGLIDVTISGNEEGDTFKGFLIQAATDARLNTELRGGFLASEEYQTMKCDRDSKKVTTIVCNYNKKYNCRYFCFKETLI